MSAPNETPLLVAVDMGYGHLRPAHTLADALGTTVFEADRPPLADGKEQRTWQRARGGYEWLTRASQRSVIGASLQKIVAGITAIPPLDPSVDLARLTLGVRYHERLIRKGLGAGLIKRLQRTGETLLTTFFTPAIVADAARLDNPIFCVVTDADVNRIWAPADPSSGRIRYLAPSQRVVQRLQAYGVPSASITLTGFPLPGELIGDGDQDVLRANLAARLVRLDARGVFRKAITQELEAQLGTLPAAEEGKPPLITFAIGGTGSQTEIVRDFLPSLRQAVIDGRLRLALVAGVRPEVARKLEKWIDANHLTGQLGRSVEILVEPDMPKYLTAFNALLARTDVLWTKPSEMTFFAALGLPVVFAPPIGAHESYNRDWALAAGAGIVQGEPGDAATWLVQSLRNGSLAACAWSGYQRLPNRGLSRICEAIRAN